MTCGKALAVAISSSAAAGGEAGVLSAMVVLLTFERKMVWREKKSKSTRLLGFASQSQELFMRANLFSTYF
jgi:hypothetical protein